MFRATLCSSSGGTIVYTQHLVLCKSLDKENDIFLPKPNYNISNINLQKQLRRTTTITHKHTKICEDMSNISNSSIIKVHVKTCSDRPKYLIIIILLKPGTAMTKGNKNESR